MSDTTIDAMTSGVLKMLECRANISPALIAARAGAAAGNQTTDRLGDVNKAAPDAEMIHFGDSFDIASALSRSFCGPIRTRWNWPESVLTWLKNAA